MDVGICWPSPGAEPQSLFDGRVLDTLRESTGATHLRVNFDHRRSTAEIIDHVHHIRAHGFEVLPILDFDYQKPSTGDYAVFCGALAGLFPAVELGNEPNTRQKIPAERYVRMFNVGAHAIRSAAPTRILIACEPTKPPGRRIDYFAEVGERVHPALYDAVAIHPYRNPNSPTYADRLFGSRHAEFAYYQSQAPGKSIAVTEVGWDLRSGITEQIQADYTYAELKLWAALGVESVYLYAYMDELSNNDYNFGVLDRQRNPRPVAAAIKQFQSERGA